MDSYNNYQSYYQQQNNTPTPPKKNKGGTFKKIMIGVVTGLLFGVFAGLGFQAVSYTTGVLDKTASKYVNKVQEAKSLEETEDANSITDKITEEITDGIKSVEEAFDSEAIDEKSDAKIEEASLNPGVATTTVTDVTEVVKQVMPSVVAVHNKYINRMSYFGQMYSQEAESAGSGIIVGKNDKELLLVTNHHVIEGAEELTVTFTDDKQAAAQVKGSDADKDLAVIAVALKDIDSDTMSSIKIAQMGDSDSLTVGEPVVAIGNSLGYGQSVTTGVVSALNRGIGLMNSSQDKTDSVFIQTDAAINPGNSGGALTNIKGQVIGINSNKIGGGVVEGMGYAIPISDAKPIIENLMTKETKIKVSEDEKGYLGITGVNVEKQHSETYGMPVGVYISSVTAGSGADLAGLVRGDIIVGLNGEELASMEELKKELEYHHVGETIELTVMQSSPTGYQAKTIMVTLGPAS